MNDSNLYSEEAEIYTLGGILQAPNALPIVLETLKGATFKSERNQCVWEAINELHQKGVPWDVVTILDTLKKKDKLAVAGGRNYILSLMESASSAANIEYHAEIIREKYNLRKLYETGSKLIAAALDPGSPAAAEITSETITKLENIASGAGSSRIVDANEAMLGKIAEIAEAKKSGKPLRIQTGIANLDRITKGMGNGELVILGAYSRMGKTSLALSIANRIAQEGRRVLFFSMEMGNTEIGARLLSMASGIPLVPIMSGNLTYSDDEERLEKAAKAYPGEYLRIQQEQLAMEEICAQAFAQHAGRGLDFLVVDYLQMTAIKGKVTSGFNRNEMTGQWTRALKKIAKSCRIPVLCLSQLNRSGAQEAKGDQARIRRPVLQDLRDSGNIEQDADQVWFIYEETKSESSIVPRTIIVAKNRNGETGDAQTLFNKPFTAYSDSFGQFSINTKPQNKAPDYDPEDEYPGY